MTRILLTVLAWAFASGAQTVGYVAELSWTDAKNPAGTIYNVYRAPGDCATPATFVKIATGTAKVYADSTIKPGKYCYQVTAGDSAPSNTATAVVPSFPPEGLTVSVTLRVNVP